jgi:3',5'-cyclic AMP phosphodiesterase CpdA
VPQKTYYKVAVSPLVDFFAINTNTFNKTQEIWLETALAQSKTPWKIVYGHHPLYSTGAHGQDNDLKVLRNRLEPLFRKYRVDAYLAGHDHNYERFATFSTQAKGLPYLQLVSGGGGAYLRSQRTHPKAHCARHKAKTSFCEEPFFPSSLFYDNTHYHYLDLAFTAKSFTIKVRSTSNQVLDEVTLKNKP